MMAGMQLSKIYITTSSWFYTGMGQWWHPAISILPIYHYKTSEPISSSLSYSLMYKMMTKL